ncbi:MAG: recombinase family protein [Solobacterium sp.]|nr:recombinase family protein [Solobacterium sp.]
MKNTDTSLIPAVIYARYSSSGQREESIEGQIRECTEYAERNGMRVIRSYADKALTGRTDRRPEFQQMIADSEKHLFSVVICWKTDRFARNRYDSAVYKARLRKNGVRLAYAREAVPEGPEGIILESVMEGFAEYYSANLAENVKRGNYDSALQHKTLGKRVFGYRKSSADTFEIDPVTGPIVTKIFQDYRSGSRMIDIVDDLNSRGIHSVTGGPFNLNAVSKILRNEKYIGTYVWQDIRDEDVIPPLIDKETFRTVQKKLAGAKKKRRNIDLDRPDFLLTGKCFCGHCGESMTGDSGKSKTGAVYWYYTCNGRRHHTCEKKREKKQDLEDFVVHQLVQILHSDDGFLEDMAQRVADQLAAGSDQSELAELKKRQTQIRQKILNLVGILEDAPSKAMASRLSALEQEDEALSVQIEEAALDAPPSLTADQILFMLTRLSDGMESDPEYRKRIVDTFLNSVYVYDDGRIVMHLNFTEGNDLATFSYTKEFVQSLDRSADRRQLTAAAFFVFPGYPLISLQNVMQE